MSKALVTKDGSLFIQLKPGGKPEYIGCVDLDAIAEPQGATTPIYCRDKNGNFERVGSTQEAPDDVTTSVTTLVFPESNILDDIKKCPVNLFALQRNCGKAGVFGNYVRGEIVHEALLQTRTWDNVIKRVDNGETTLKLDFAGATPVYKPREVTVARQSIAETVALNAIANCSEDECEGDCGPLSNVGDDLLSGGDFPSGSPSEKADIWQTEDGGDAWTNITGGAGHPFAAGTSVVSVGCFWMDKSTTRWLAVQGVLAGQHLKVAYSDDGGVTWTQVEVAQVDAEGGVGQDSLCALDREHIWIATTAGNIYFSEDGGASWVLQDDAVVADGGLQLNAIKFSDENNGVAVGNTDTLITTNDGGDTWAAGADPASGANLTALQAFSKYRWLVGSSNDKLYQTWDAGVNWETKTYTGQGTTGTIKLLEFCNALIGFMLHNTAAPVGSVHRTIDGGHNWEKLVTPTNAGLNGLVALNENLAYAVGEPQGGTAVVLKIS